MKADRGDLLRGTLEMLILRTLEDGPMHGYGITERLQRVSGEVLAVEEGSLYPALYRMQQRGLVKSKWGRSENNRKARFYTITAKGNHIVLEVDGVKTVDYVEQEPGIGLDGAPGQQRELLEHHGDVARGRRQGGDVVAGDLDESDPLARERGNRGGERLVAGDGHE